MQTQSACWVVADPGRGSKKVGTREWLIWDAFLDERKTRAEQIVESRGRQKKFPAIDNQRAGASMFMNGRDKHEKANVEFMQVANSRSQIRPQRGREGGEEKTKGSTERGWRAAKRIPSAGMGRFEMTQGGRVGGLEVGGGGGKRREVS